MLAISGLALKLSFFVFDVSIEYTPHNLEGARDWKIPVMRVREKKNVAIHTKNKQRNNTCFMMILIMSLVPLFQGI